MQLLIANMSKLHALLLKIILFNLIIGSVWCAAAPAADALAAASASSSASPAANAAPKPIPQFQEYDLPTGSDAAAPGLYDTSAVAIDGLVSFDGGDEFSASSVLPSFEVTPCSLSDPNRNECIKNLIQTIAPKLKQNGIPEYGMGSIDPYFYRRGIFRYANDGVQGGLLIKNMNIHGISTIKVNSVQSNFTENGFIVKLGVEIPKLRADGQFKADVKFGGLRLVPKGPFNITIDNVRATILTDGIIQNTENGQRLSLSRLNANVAVGETRIIANGIFTDRNLNSMILNLVNENLPEITRVGIPATREQWAPILVTHINQFFANVPIEKFLVQ